MVRYLFRIGEFSKLSKTTVKTLRYYDEAGLLKPEKVDVLTNYRYYTTEQLLQLHRIQAFRLAGLTLAEIRSILSGADERELLRMRRTGLETELSQTKQQLSCIDFLLSGKDKESIMTYSATIKEIPECIVFSKTACVPNYEAFMTFIPQVGADLSAANPDLKCCVPDYCFTMYLDGEYREKDITIEYCQAVESVGVETNGIVFKTVPAATVVSVMHKGPYQNLGQAYAFVFKWIEENGYTVAASPRESYIDGIWNKENPEDWLTEIQVPVVKEIN